MLPRFRVPEVGSFDALVNEMNRLVPADKVPDIYLYMLVTVPVGESGLGTVLRRMVESEVADMYTADLALRDETTVEGANGDDDIPPESYDLMDTAQALFRRRQYLVDMYDGKVKAPSYGFTMPTHEYLIGEGMLAASLVLYFMASYAIAPWKNTTPPNTNTPPHDLDIPHFRRADIR